MQQIQELLHLYSGLSPDLEDASQIVLSGNILVYCSAKGFSICEEYEIKIVVPIFSDKLPYVIETGGRIDEQYPHRYPDGELCLETDTSIRMWFVEGFSLSTWVSKYVETYFFSYEYYQRRGEFPFGERAHGLEGVLQTYEDLFKETDFLKILQLMKSIVSQPYRGHTPCPCGSGKRFRLCHGLSVMKYHTDNRLRAIVLNDYNELVKGIRKYNEQRRYSTQTK